MKNRTIRLATEADLPRILELIECGRQKMRAVGNLEQWTNGHPRPEVLLQDIEDGNSFLVEDDGEAVATFAFVEGPDPTYEHIYHGRWLDEPDADGLFLDEMGDFGQNGVSFNPGEYHVIHRIASAPDAHGIMRSVFDFCFARAMNIRIDTHRQNAVMRTVLPRFGFRYCGIIYLADGAERLAYQWCPFLY